MNAETSSDLNGNKSNVKTETMPPKILITPRKHDAPVVLNRAQRRALAKYIRRKAAPMRRLQRETRAQTTCQHCGKIVILAAQTLFEVGLKDRIERCQCPAADRHACAMCGAVFMASPKEYRRTNVCAQCAEQIRVQREREAKSASAAQERWYAQRLWDDEQHRLAQENRQ